MNWRAETTLFSPWYRNTLESGLCMPSSGSFCCISLWSILDGSVSRLLAGHCCLEPTAPTETLGKATPLALDPILFILKGTYITLCITTYSCDCWRWGWVFLSLTSRRLYRIRSHWVLGKFSPPAFIALETAWPPATYSNWESPQSELLLLIILIKSWDHFFQLFDRVWQITQNSISINLMGQVTVTNLSWISIS